MLNYKQFEEMSLSDVAREEAVKPDVVNNPQPDNSKNEIEKYSDTISAFINKIKTSNTGTTTQQSDPLTLKIQNFRAGQAIDIKLNPNIEIKAQVVASGKKKFCKLLKSNIEEITLLLNPQKSQQTNNSSIVDKVGNPMKAQPTQPKPIYFQTFRDNKNKNLTWFYFYDNMDFVTNSKQQPVFSKTYTIISVE